MKILIARMCSPFSSKELVLHGGVDLLSLSGVLMVHVLEVLTLSDVEVVLVVDVLTLSGVKMVLVVGVSSS